MILATVNRDYFFYSVLAFFMTTVGAGMAFDGGNQGIGWSLAILSAINLVGWFLYVVFVPPMTYGGSED